MTSYTREKTASAAAITSVVSSVSVMTLLGANVLRQMATVFNDSTAVLYLKLGTAASTTSYTVQIPAKGYYELPHPTYHGVVTGVWASANGAARLTEVS